MFSPKPRDFNSAIKSKGTPKFYRVSGRVLIRRKKGGYDIKKIQDRKKFPNKKETLKMQNLIY